MWDYEIENITSSDYKLKLKLLTNKNQFRHIFNKAVAKLQRKMSGVGDIKDMELPDLVVIPENLRNLLATAVKPLVREVRDSLKDNVVLTSGKITNAWYSRDKTEKTRWHINIEIEGGYKDA